MGDSVKLLKMRLAEEISIISNSSREPRTISHRLRVRDKAISDFFNCLYKGTKLI